MRDSAGRRYAEPVGGGPVAELAIAMRKDIEDRGATLRSIKKGAELSASLISELLSGARLPSKEYIDKIASGAGATAKQAADWQGLREQCQQAMERLRPELGLCRTSVDLLKAFRTTFEPCGFDLDAAIVLVERTDPAKVRTVVDGVRKPEEKQIRDVFGSSSASLTPNLLAWMVFAGGGRRKEVRHWVRAYQRLPRHYGAEPFTVTEPHRAVQDEAASDLPDARGPVRSGKPVRSGEQVQSGGPAGVDGQSRTDSQAGADDPIPPSAPSGVPVWRRWRVWVAVVTLLTVASGLAWLHEPEPRKPSTGAVAPVESPPSPLPDRRAPDPRTRNQLVQLGARSAWSADAAGSGPFTHVHRQTTFVDTTSTDPAAKTVSDEKLWWTNDGTGTTGLRVTNTGRPGQESRIHREYLQPGDLEITVGQPSTDPTVLRQQLEKTSRAQTGPARWLSAVAAVNDQHHLDPQQRVAIFDVLGTVEGITYADQGVDELDRPGLAFSADNADGTRRETLLFDPTSGVLLNHETVRLASNPAEEYVISSTLYLESGRRNKSG